MKARWMVGCALVGVLAGASVAVAAGQQEESAPEDPPREVAETGLKQRDDAPFDSITIPRGTRVPLVLINSISTKHAAPGDRVYLESVYPVVVDGRVVVPPGTYVSGSVTGSKRPGRLKGKGELFLLFEQMILPNGTIRDLVGRVGSLDGRAPEGLDRDEGRITSESSKGGDARTVGETTAAGTSIGVIAGASGGRAGLGAGVGAAAGAAAGLMGVLLSRGPEAVLKKGTQLDMTLDRDLYFTEEEMTFRDALRRPGGGTPSGDGPDRDRIRDRGNGRFRRLPP